MRRSEHVRIYVLIVGIAAVAGVALVMMNSSRDAPWRAAAQSLPGVLKEARAAGLPLEISDLGIKETPDSQNAATVYLPVFKQLSGFAPNAHTIESEFYLGAYEPTKMTARAKESRPKIAALLDRLGRARKLPGVSFKRDWSQGFALALPELADANTATKLLCGEALLSAAEGRFNRALQMLDSADRLAYDIGREPMIISAMRQRSMTTTVLRAVEKISSDQAGDDSKLARLESFVATMRPPPDFRRAITGDMVMARITASQLRSLSDILGPHECPPAPDLWGLERIVGLGEDCEQRRLGDPPTKFLRPALGARLLQYWIRAYPLYRDDSAKSRQQLAALRAKYDASKDPTFRLASFAIPIEGAREALDRAVERRAMVLAKIAILRFKLRTGKYPASLAALGPSPTDAQWAAIRYRIEGGGFTLYSARKKGNGEPENVVKHPFDPLYRA